MDMQNHLKITMNRWVLAFFKKIKIMKLILCSIVFCCITAVAQELKDPTEPYANPSSQMMPKVTKDQPYELTEILIANEHCLAVINGKFFKVGDKLDKKEIQSITPYSVKLIGADGETELKIFGGNIKDTSK